MVFSFLKRVIHNLFKNSPEDPVYHDSLESFLLNVLKIEVNSLEYYIQAFTHTSKTKSRSESFERLEFLGDAVLGAVAADRVFKEFPKDNEGELSKHRSKIVSRKSLNFIGEQLELSQYITASKQGKLAKSLSGNALESLIGAIYLDLGWERTVQFIDQKVLPFIDFENLAKEIISYKSLIIELAAKNKFNVSYVLLTQSGLDHEKVYEIGFSLNGEIISKAKSGSKKKAEEKVSELVYKQELLTVKL